jgi:hypothetical protein
MAFALLGGLLGMFLAIFAGWLAKKQMAQGLAKAQQAAQIANFAFLVALVIFTIVVATW